MDGRLRNDKYGKVKLRKRLILVTFKGEWELMGHPLVGEAHSQAAVGKTEKG